MERVRLQKTVKIQFAQPDNVPLLLDVVRPADEGQYPIILTVFGGGWCSGDRSTLGAASHRLARAGYVVCNCDYRLAPAYPYPAAVDDLHAALGWIHDHAAEFSGDTSRVGAYGVSAGGHLVAMLATEHEKPLTCAVSWGGPMDLRHNAVTRAYRSYPLAFMGACPHDTADLYTEASPVCRLTEFSSPLLLIHGSNDPVVPIVQCRHMMDAAQTIGAQVESFELTGAFHEPGDPREPIIAAAWEKIITFFSSHLEEGRPELRYASIGCTV